MFIKPALDLIAIVGEAARAEKSGDFQVSYSSPMNFGGGYMVQFVSPRSLQCGTPVYLDRDGEIARLRAEVDELRKQLSETAQCLADVSNDVGGWAVEEVIQSAMNAAMGEGK